MSNITKRQRLLSRIFGILSFLLAIAPAIVFVIMGFACGTPTQKIAIGFTGITAIVLLVFSLISKLKIKKSVFWIAMFGMIGLFDSLGYMFIIVGVGQILDEIIVSPLHHRFKEDYHTNKQIDKREKLNGEQSTNT